MRVKRMIMLSTSLFLGGALCSFVLFLNCPNPLYAEVTSDNKGLYIEEPKTSDLQNITASCSSNCNCPLTEYNPVCAGNVSHLSPCRAGCSQPMVEVDGVKQFRGCNCAPGSIVTPGSCDELCSYSKIAVFLAVFGLLFMFMMCASIPALTATLRSVPLNVRPLAVGMQWIIIRLLGLLPGPSIGGSQIDTSCLLWNTDCSGNRGNCLIYSRFKLSQSFFAVTLAPQVLACLLLVAAAQFYRGGNEGEGASQVVEGDGRVTSGQQARSHRGTTLTFRSDMSLTTRVLLGVIDPTVASHDSADDLSTVLSLGNEELEELVSRDLEGSSMMSRRNEKDKKSAVKFPSTIGARNVDTNDNLQPREVKDDDLAEEVLPVPHTQQSSNLRNLSAATSAGGSMVVPPPAWLSRKPRSAESSMKKYVTADSSMQSNSKVSEMPNVARIKTQKVRKRGFRRPHTVRELRDHQSNEV